MSGQPGAAAVPLSLLPILLFMFLLLKCRTRSVTAAAAGFAVSAAAGLCYFGAHGGLLLAEYLKGLWNAAVIFYVVLTAMLIYEGLSGAGMFARIRERMEGSIRDDLLRVLFVGWGFTSFLQSITGFGVPVAVAAPILTGLGLGGIQSVVVCILGHAWGGTFGTLAIAWDSLLAQAQVSPADAGRVALYACLLLWGYNLLCGVAICCVYRHGAPRGRDLFYVCVISLVQGGGQLLAAQRSASVACFLASGASLAVILLLDRIPGRGARGEPRRKGDSPLCDLLAPYLFLVALVVGVLFVPPVNRALSRFQVGFSFSGGALYSPVSLFTHSGTLLLATGIFTCLFYHRRGYLAGRPLAPAFGRALRKSLGSIFPILFLIMMSKVMDGSGQVRVLSDGLASALGSVYPLFAPFIGILGAFISSSNMSSNILFAGFQQNAAVLLSIDPAVMLAAQTAGGSIGNLLATSNIVLGLTTTGCPGQEGRVLRAMLPVCALAGVCCGGAALALSLFAPPL